MKDEFIHTVYDSISFKLSNWINNLFIRKKAVLNNSSEIYICCFSFINNNKNRLVYYNMTRLDRIKDCVMTIHKYNRNKTLQYNS